MPEAIARLSEVVLECTDPQALARFYAQLTGWQVVQSDDDWVTLAESRGAPIKIAFQRAPGYQPPVWPDDVSSMQLHLDFNVRDLDEAELAATQMGATKFAQQPDPDNFRVMADPAGHPFCLCVN